MTSDVSTSSPLPSAAAAARSRQRLAIGFLNGAHALDHFVILIYPTVVIELAAISGRSYSELIALGTASFIAFGLFSLPAGWLADRWSRRNMMAAFYIGCGLSLIGAAFAPSLYAPLWRCSRSASLPPSIIRSAPRCLSRTRPNAAARLPSTAFAAISASPSSRHHRRPDRGVPWAAPSSCPA